MSCIRCIEIETVEICRVCFFMDLWQLFVEGFGDGLESEQVCSEAKRQGREDFQMLFLDGILLLILAY